MPKRPFAPQVRKTKLKGQTVYEVDCRQWKGVMQTLAHPQRRRFDHRQLAESWRQQLIVDHAAGRRSEPGPVAVRSLCEHFLRSIKSNRSPSTYKSYRSRLRGFLAYLDRNGIRDVRDVSPGTLELYRLELVDRGLRSAGIRGHLIALRSLYSWANRMCFVDGNPAAAIEMPNKQNRRRCFTDGEVEVLFAHGRLEWLPIWRFLLATGMRRIEIARLTITDVVLDTPAPFVRVHGKGDKYRDIPLESNQVRQYARCLVDAAASVQRERVLPVGHVRLGAWWALQRQEVGLPEELTLHCFRHTTATWLVNRVGLQLTEVQEVMGHAKLSTTARYVHRDRKVLRAGMSALGELVAQAVSGTNLVSANRDNPVSR